MARKGYVYTENSQMASIDTVFISIYYKKQLNLWPNSSDSCGVNHNWLSVCQAEMELFEEYLSTHGCLTSLRNKHQQKQAGQLQHQFLAKLLVNVLYTAII